MPNILVVTPTLEVKTVADVIAYAKAQPDGISMASSGNGTLQHLSLEMFRFVTGVKINHVPYRGGSIALQDVMAGQVKFFFANGSSVVGLIKGGKVKAIAHTGKGRLESLPDIPPVSDTLPDVQARFAQLNIDSRPTTPEEFAAFVKEQTARWSKVVKDANIKLG